jgi:hypothetical protein
VSRGGGVSPISPYIGKGNTHVSAVWSDCGMRRRLILQNALILLVAKCYIRLRKTVNIRAVGTARRIVDMGKPNSAFANDSKQSSTSAPQISDTPTITSTGTLAWNVRDILFGPNRTAGTSTAGTSEQRKNASKSSLKE